MFVEMVLPRSHQGVHRSAMEGIAQGNDRAAAFAVAVAGILPGDLEHTLVGLRARVCKKYPGKARALAEFFSKPGGGLGIVQV